MDFWFNDVQIEGYRKDGTMLQYLKVLLVAMPKTEPAKPEVLFSMENVAAALGLKIK